MARASSPSSLNQECHICLEELRKDLVTAPCGHVYHHLCILQALQVNTQCPICRRRTGDADLITLYFDVPGADSPAAVEQDQEVKPGHATGDSVELSSRVNSLMERVQWQNKQQERLVDELRRLRSQSEQLLVDKQALAQRVGRLEATKTELMTKVARYQMELSRQTEAARRQNVNQSIINYLETCDAAAMEEEIQNPRELIMALKKACKFRHDQYQKVVKDKMRLKAMLQNSQQPSQQQQQQQAGARMGKAKSRSGSAAFESKRPYPAAGDAMTFNLGSEPVLENKKRKIDSVSMLPNSLLYMQRQIGDEAPTFTPRSDSTGFRANAYSDVSIRPPSSSRQTFGRSSFNLNQYGAYNLTPASQPPVQMVDTQAAVCRRGYDETDPMATLQGCKMMWGIRIRTNRKLTNTTLNRVN
ncbi:hypothetical protein BBP00_00000179 [Phytophthora kernoviae]|uniref:RING-type domain-containing protein n=1 Tax=Phytophthora kernoviae TaxID=325452 RepID=A0A3F2S3R4_9STRA|nr:hypothetical protein BBP00_00000179 [Phytophthora kernoviae]